MACLYTAQGNIICYKKNYNNLEKFEVNPKSNERITQIDEKTQQKIDIALKNKCSINFVNNPKTNIPELNITNCKNKSTSS